MIVAMACGTPVVAFPGGSVAEIVESGTNGFIVEEVEAAVDAIRHVARLDRARCRESFETRFSVERMARDYVSLYERAIGSGALRRPWKARGATRRLSLPAVASATLRS
jgi:glycosyltransferase involved in cell wall biosynthesis